MNTEEKPVVLKVGQKYELRNGLLTSPLRSTKDSGYKFEATVDEYPGRPLSVMCWLPSGRALTNSIEHKHDIIKKV